MTKDFKAVMLKPAQDAEISIIDFNGKMAICADEGPILVTKEQAMKFFDLQPATTVQEPVGEWVGGRSKDSDPKRISWKPGYVSSAKVGDKIYTAPPAAPVQPVQEPKQCGLCGEAQPFTGTCGGGRDNPKALCYTPPAAPVQPVQEPVADAWMHKDGRLTDAKAKTARVENFHGWRPLAFIASATPPAAPVPLTPEQRKNLWVSATIELPSQENCYYRGLLDAEAYHGITKKGGAA
jgi:hypothetical protein